ncbi:MAG: hypothetical protein RBS24_00760 [Bacilli bacterium]|nr:hypothetical protein [Bacilli bacterium]
MMTINYEPVYNPRNDVVKEYFHSFAPYFDKAVFDENRKVYELNAQSLSEIMGEAIEGMSYLVYFEDGAIHHTEAVAMMSDENFDQNLMLSFYLTKENETTVVVPETYDTCDHAGNMNDYYQHDEHCHYQPCTICGGLVKWGAHEFDGDKCSVCGYIKVKRMHISVPGCEHDHIYYDLRESTGETEYVYFTGYQSNNYESTADGQKVTYNFVDCNFVATITDKTTLVAGETCKHEKMYTITFTRNGEKLREDAVIRGTYSYNHAFVFESESKDPLTCIKTTISRCSKCGEIQEIKIIDHQALTVTNHGVKMKMVTMKMRAQHVGIVTKRSPAH